ncbi:FeS assembly ATPase SufC [mine drainage metagenome]|uniref:FeS assembly ATPase SufC n=1 Tax=mine drainage metagenome TaxID=410659 RepID=T1BGI8_9ZZZZ
MLLEIKDLHVNVEKKEILHGISLKIRDGETHVIMGPNGSGKTTLAKAIFGHPSIKVTSGDIIVDGKSILPLSTDKRAALGLFLGFQNPVEIEGVGFVNFLRASKESLEKEKYVNMKELMQQINSNIESLKIAEGIVGRSLNKGFSGGEKKKAEILQMAIEKPKIAILDEPDSGLDIDAIKIVASNIDRIMKENGMGTLIITHYSRILSYLKPEFVHVLVGGKIAQSGGADIISKLEKEGYKAFEGD